MGGRTFEREKHPLQQLHLKKGDGCIFEGGLIFSRVDLFFRGWTYFWEIMVLSGKGRGSSTLTPNSPVQGKLSSYVDR